MGRAGRLGLAAPLAAAMALLAERAQAECATAATAARCVTAGSEEAPAREVGRRVSARQTNPSYAPGDVLPDGKYYRLLNSEYYGLPPAEDGWRYYEVEGRVLRVRPDTMEVVGDATAETNGAF